LGGFGIFPGTKNAPSIKFQFFLQAYQIKQDLQKKRQLAARAKIPSPEIPGLAYSDNNLLV